MAELIITEKPSTAQKIAFSLSDGKAEKNTYMRKVPFYELTYKGKKIFVVCAVGHLYNLAEAKKGKWTYPVFDLEWKPVFEINKASSFTKPYLNAIKSVAKKAKEFTIATDFDQEGEVIGYNILNYACNQKDGRRMKFSTTTKDDLLEAYDHALPHIDFPQADAGLARHMLDWWYGVNLSRALTLSIKNATGMFKIMSSGRVQGPALAILAARENEIKAFKPEPFWQIELIAKELSALHSADKFWDKKEANKSFKNAKKDGAVVEKIEKTETKQPPPSPFDLTALQLAAYKLFGISPKETLSIAQDLYVNSYISYPRTSSNQLPESVNYRKVITALSKQDAYADSCQKLLKQKALKPNNGTKKDSAHPAIYPTGEIPSLKGASAKLYDLIVKRTLATFGEEAVRENTKIEINASEEKFHAKGIRTTYKGWHDLYAPYVKLDEQELPKLKEGQELDVKEIRLHDKETSPPKRYTPASIIKDLEKHGLGTKATRSEIIEQLFNRNYVTGAPIEVTKLGLKTVETLKKYCPEILDEGLTRQFEEDMEKIREKEQKGKDVLNEARKVLTNILSKFKENEDKIGNALAAARKETLDKESIVGKCKLCNSDLRILRSRKYRSYFVACSGYPKCRNTFSLPAGMPKPTGKECERCGFPLVLIIRAGKRPFEYCINKQCPQKLEWIKEQEKKKTSPEQETKKEDATSLLEPSLKPGRRSRVVKLEKG
ncbi:MAG: DNA topoisomerase I [Candidatus Woesearchaeota archaeon]